MSKGPLYLVIFGTFCLTLSTGMFLLHLTLLGEKVKAEQCEASGFIILDTKVYTCAKVVVK